MTELPRRCRRCISTFRRAQLAAAHAADYDAVFTLGGDGTAIEVIGALAHVGPPVGILPGGTGNIVARTLGTPARIGKAVERLLNGDEARIDLGVLELRDRDRSAEDWAGGWGADREFPVFGDG